jgi:hypothetical protein
MHKQFTKGDIVAIVETRVTLFVHGMRPSKTSTTVRIVRVESASRDGNHVGKYSTYPGSPTYPYNGRYNRSKLLAIKCANMQKNARRLFDAATGPLDYDSEKSAQGAVIFA